MLKYSYTTNLSICFGDFGGNDCVNDFDFNRKNPDTSKIEKIIISDEFEKEFRNILSTILPEGISVKTHGMKGGQTLYVVPAKAKVYNLAAQLTFAKLVGEKKVFVGTYLKNIALLAAQACKAHDLSLIVKLSRVLCSDADLVKDLKALGAEVDDTTCIQYFDLPYAYSEEPFVSKPEFHVAPIEANYGLYPKPAITGLFAGIFGMDVLAQLGKTPECCVVPITTGTEAIGTFKALLNTTCKLATAEELIAQEFHLIDTGTYTLSTRSSNKEQDNTTLCPELVSWWRTAKVMRLGCDRIYPVDTSLLNSFNLSLLTARAAALAIEATHCKEILVLEVK
ncbi:MAG: hypothetical protein GYA55_14205 [SAR324 cluster bacterium]|uniref:Uncharacterized protein n=1 Tax=SAR324 cluster bacterium TaxID=2024889 RepID=A0A7X9FU23_9DELT|nr:hypothetical protein [SAR324 cluster bacterium]